MNSHSASISTVQVAHHYINGGLCPGSGAVRPVPQAVNQPIAFPTPTPQQSGPQGFKPAYVAPSFRNVVNVPTYQYNVGSATNSGGDGRIVLGLVFVVAFVMLPYEYPVIGVGTGIVLFIALSALYDARSKYTVGPRWAKWLAALTIVPTIASIAAIVGV